VSKSSLYAVLFLLCAVSALYGQFTNNAIVFDDTTFFTSNEVGHQPIDEYRYSPFEMRSLPNVSFTWGKALLGLDIKHFRIENMLLHAAVVVTLFFFLMRLFRTLLPKRVNNQLSFEALAFSAALLFALHPVAVYAVGYLVQRTMLMATLFSLLSMLTWMYGDERTSKPWLWISVLFYYLAVFSKEHAIMLPTVLLALTVLLHEDWPSRIKRYWAHISVLVLLALFVVEAKRGMLGVTYETYAPDMLTEPSDGLNYPLSVLTQSWLFFKYAALWLFPNPHWMSIDMREPFADSLWSGYLVALLSFLTMLGLAISMLCRRGRIGLLGFAIIFPCLMFIPEFSSIRIQESFVLYRSYLWAVGACALLPLLVDALDKRVAFVLVGAIAIAMVPISMDRLASFAHPLVLWDDAVKLVKGRTELPGASRIYYNRGTELYKLGDYDLAKEDLKLAAQLNPEWPFAYSNLGAVLLKKQDWDGALGALNRAIDIANHKRMGVNPRAHLARAMAYEKLGKKELASQDYEISCRLANKGCDKLNRLSR